MRLRFGVAKNAWGAGGAQVASTEVFAGTAFEGRALDDRDVFNGDWVGEGQERRRGEDVEDLSELHID
jgi:hypothetical protein